MKTATHNTARAHSFASFRDMWQYLVYLALFILCSLAQVAHIRPFAIGLFVGLVYCRRNLWLLSPLLLCAAVLGELSWQSVTLAACCIAVLALAYTVHTLLKRPVKAWQLVLYAFVSQIPTVFIYGMQLSSLLWGVASLFISTLFSFCCVVMCRLVLVKGIRTPTSLEELASALCAVVIASGLYRLAVQRVVIGFLFYGFLLLAVPRLFRAKGALLCFLLGAGCWVISGQPIFVALFGLYGATAYFLRGYHPAWSALAIVAADCIANLALSLVADYFYPNTLLLAGGCLIYSVLPRSVRSKLERLFSAQGSTATRYLVNRNRLELHDKLQGVADVLADMRTVLLGGISNLPPVQQNKNYLAKQLSAAVCNGCAHRPQCEQALSASTAVAMYDLIARHQELGHLTLLEAPAFFADTCIRPQQAVTTCKQLLADYASAKKVADDVDQSKQALCQQLQGLSGMMQGLATDVKQVVSYDTRREKKLVEDLSNHNIIAQEAVIYRLQGQYTLILIVRDQDVDKAVLTRILTRHLGALVRQNATPHGGGWIALRYVSAPPLSLVTGQNAACKQDSERSGDTYSVTRIGTDKVLLAVCDGMGSGTQAANGSNAALSLVESFYSAGIDDNIVLDLVNKLLVVRNDECFQALDMCVIDLRHCHADFIKLGAPESVIRLADSIRVIPGGALPMGILANVTPKVTRVELHSGDMIVMCTDGISESIGIEGVVRMVEQNPTSNPQTLAALVVEDALYVDRNDDKTVLCARVFATD